MPLSNGNGRNSYIVVRFLPVRDVCVPFHRDFRRYDFGVREKAITIDFKPCNLFHVWNPPSTNRVMISAQLILVASIFEGIAVSGTTEAYRTRVRTSNKLWFGSIDHLQVRWSTAARQLTAGDSAVCLRYCWTRTARSNAAAFARAIAAIVRGCTTIILSIRDNGSASCWNSSGIKKSDETTPILTAL